MLRVSNKQRPLRAALTTDSFRHAEGKAAPTADITQKAHVNAAPTAERE